MPTTKVALNDLIDGLQRFLASKNLPYRNPTIGDMGDDERMGWVIRFEGDRRHGKNFIGRYVTVPVSLPREGPIPGLISHRNDLCRGDSTLSIVHHDGIAHSSREGYFLVAYPLTVTLVIHNVRGNSIDGVPHQATHVHQVLAIPLLGVHGSSSTVRVCDGLTDFSLSETLKVNPCYCPECKDRRS